MHLVEQVERQLPPASLLAGANQAAVGDDVALAVPGHHVLEYLDRLLHLLDAPTGWLSGCLKLGASQCKHCSLGQLTLMKP